MEGSSTSGFQLPFGLGNLGLPSPQDIMDLARTVPQIIEARGYECETHDVLTPDGYILAVHRIINPMLEGIKGKPVILMHAMLDSSVTWVIQNSKDMLTDNIIESDAPVGNMLGFELARRGYDVWMPNARGNTYSRKHVSLNPTSKRFL